MENKLAQTVLYGNQPEDSIISFDTINNNEFRLGFIQNYTGPQIKFKIRFKDKLAHILSNIYQSLCDRCTYLKNYHQ